MDDFPKCKVCQEHFTLKGPSPYLLPCLHAVCETCVTSTDGGVISCSSCQREVNLTQTHLQKDVVRQREIFHLTVQHRPSELLCTHEDDGNQAVCWCQECEEFLCEHCQTLHESFKATRRHIVQDVGDIKPCGLDYDEYCSIHKKYLLDCWDKSCNILICGRCKQGDHANHDLEDIDVAADAARMEMNSEEKDVQKVGDNHTSLLERRKAELKHTQETSNNLTDKISHTFQSLKVLLDQREKELLIALQQHTDQTKSDLDAKSKVSQSAHLECSMTTEYIRKALLYPSKYDLLKIKKMIGERTQICLASAPPEKQDDLPPPEFYTEGLERLKTSLIAFGDIMTLKDMACRRPGIKDKTTQTDTEFLVNLEEIQNLHQTTVENIQADLTKSVSRTKQLETTVASLTKQKEHAESELKESLTKLKESVTEKDDIQKQKVAIPTFLEMQLQQQGVYFLKADTMAESFLLHCINLKYDLDRVNLSKTHIDNNGVLVNKPGKGPRGNTSGRFQKYSGTTSTAPLPQTGHPQYMEVVSNVGIDKPVEEHILVLELGVCREEEMDVMHYIPDHQYCYSLEVAHCLDHNSGCTNVWKDGEVADHVSDTLPNTGGSPTTLHYGMVYDSNRKVIVLIDVKGMEIIKMLDNVNCDKPMWPRISMKLVVGNEINMTPEKKAMILQAL